MKTKIKNFLLQMILGSDYKAVQSALKFSAYTHNRRSEYAQRDEMQKVINKLGMN